MRSTRSLVASRARRKAFKPAFRWARPGRTPAPASSLACPSAARAPPRNAPATRTAARDPKGSPIPSLCAPQGGLAHTLCYFCSLYLSGPGPTKTYPSKEHAALERRVSHGYPQSLLRQGFTNPTELVSGLCQLQTCSDRPRHPHVRTPSQMFRYLSLNSLAHPFLPHCTFFLSSDALPFQCHVLPFRPIRPSAFHLPPTPTPHALGSLRHNLFNQ